MDKWTTEQWFKSYPKIHTLGDKENEGILSGTKLFISEKIDGTNVRFCVVDGAIIYGTHRTILGPLENIPKNHMHRNAAELIAAKVTPDILNSNYIYYMEGFGGTEEQVKRGKALHHTLKYPLPTSVIGIDVWVWAEAPVFEGSELRGRFIQADVAKQEFERLGLDYVPLLYSGKDRWSPESLKALLASSQLYPGIPEGIAIKAYNTVNKWGRQLFAKLVRDEFKEQMKAAWGTAKTVSPEPEIVKTYCTPARIAKKFYEVVGAGAEASMKLVPFLGKLVYEDIWDENWRTLIYTDLPIDFKVLRNRVYGTVAKHLKRILAETAT